MITVLYQYLEGAFDSEIRHSRLGHLNTVLARGGGVERANFQKIKRSGGCPGGMLNFRIDRRTLLGLRSASTPRHGVCVYLCNSLRVFNK